METTSYGQTVYKVDEFAAKAALKKGIVLEGSSITETIVAWVPGTGGDGAYIERENNADLYESSEAAIKAYLTREENRLNRQKNELSK